MSLPPDLGIVTVSPKAWKVAEEVKYSGYDALLPFKNALEISEFPYTHNWRAVAALEWACDQLLKEGLEKSYKRHEEVAQYCRDRLKKMGLKLFPKLESSSSPTVTAVYVPDGWTWKDLDAKLREKGVVFGGSYGELKNKIFRIGHMGTQADMELVKKAMDVLEEVLKK